MALHCLKSDLLFSTIVSHWIKQEMKIEDLLKTINSIGEHFKFTNDFIRRTWFTYLIPVFAQS